MSERPIRALIVDDEPLARTRIRSLLDGERAIEIIGEAGSGTAAVAAIVRDKPDLVFLDIQMPGIDGFEVVRATAGEDRPFIIFITAHDEHAIKAFEVEAIDYLLKPVTEERFKAALARALARLRETPRADLVRAIDSLLKRVPAPDAAPAGRIPIRKDGSVTFVRHDDIDWVDADGDFVRIHAGRETHAIRETMAEIEGKLLPPRFVRVHRSVIVNADRVKEIQPWFKGDYVLILHNGVKLRSGRTYRERVQALMR